MQSEPYPVSRWIVVGAGAGGTSATPGRYIRYASAQRSETRLAVVDPEHLVFIDYDQIGDATLTPARIATRRG